MAKEVNKKNANSKKVKEAKKTKTKPKTIKKKVSKKIPKKIQNKKKVANLCRITYGQSTAAYVIKKSGLIKLTQNYLEALSTLKSNSSVLKNNRLRGAFNMRFAIDNYWSQIQAQRNCYAYDIQIGYIEEGYSDVTESVKSLEAQTMQRPFGYDKKFF